MVIGRRSLLLSSAALPASAYGQCVINSPAADACRGGVRNAGPAGQTLDLNFMFPGSLDSRITFTRASSATYTDASGVVQTAATNAPRWDYANGVLRGLLIEEARTNIWLQSADANNAAWFKGAAIVALPTTTANQSVAPDGTTTAARVAIPAVSGAGAFSSLYQQFTVTASIYTFSMWLKGNVGGEQLYLAVGGGGVANALVTLTTQWQRFALITPTLTAGSSYFEVGVDLRDAGQSTKPAQTIYAWGAQVEQGAFPTSYIPTTSVSVTRAADVATMPTNVSWYNQSAGSGQVTFVNVAQSGAGTQNGLFTFDDGTGNNIIWSNAFSVPNQFVPVTQVLVGGASSGYLNYGAITQTPVAKQVATWTSSATLRITANGGTVQSVALTTALPTVSRLVFGNALGFALNGYLQRLNYWNRALSDAEMQAVTS